MNELNDSMNEQAARGNDFEQAANYLASAVKADPNNEEAWLLLGDYLSDAEKRRFCYQNVLKLNPTNEQAQQALNQLDFPAPPEMTELLPEIVSPDAPTLVHNQTQAEPTITANFLAKQAEYDAPEDLTTTPSIPENEIDSPVLGSDPVFTEFEDSLTPTEIHPAEVTPFVTTTAQPLTNTTPKSSRPRTLNRKRSPLRFLLLIFPLMLLILIGLIAVMMIWKIQLP